MKNSLYSKIFMLAFLFSCSSLKVDLILHSIRFLLPKLKGFLCLIA